MGDGGGLGKKSAIGEIGGKSWRGDAVRRKQGWGRGEGKGKLQVVKESQERKDREKGIRTTGENLQGGEEGLGGGGMSAVEAEAEVGMSREGGGGGERGQAEGR